MTIVFWRDRNAENSSQPTKSLNGLKRLHWIPQTYSKLTAIHSPIYIFNNWMSTKRAPMNTPYFPGKLTWLSELMNYWIKWSAPVSFDVCERNKNRRWKICEAHAEIVTMFTSKWKMVFSPHLVVKRWLMFVVSRINIAFDSHQFFSNFVHISSKIHRQMY